MFVRIINNFADNWIWYESTYADFLTWWKTVRKALNIKTVSVFTDCGDTWNWSKSAGWRQGRSFNSICDLIEKELRWAFAGGIDANDVFTNFCIYRADWNCNDD